MTTDVCVVVHLPAELTVATAGEIRLALLDALAVLHSVDLDLGGLQRVDPAGVHALLAVRGAVQAAGGRLGFRNASPAATRAFAAAGVDGVLEAEVPWPGHPRRSRAGGLASG